MSDSMSERPTVERVIDDYIYSVRADESPYAPELVAALAEHGYVIVHPDDVPERGPNPTDLTIDFDIGWKYCRARIFGATA